MPETKSLTYNPKPVDTSGVRLDPDQIQAVELLARNIHDLWALRRITEGWVCGPQRDDRKRFHPCLVPYEELETGEKDYDRTIALETLKLLIHLGYRVSRG